MRGDRVLFTLLGVWFLVALLMLLLAPVALSAGVPVPRKHHGWVSQHELRGADWGVRR